ncbi:WG repeat-containing protein [Cohnella herbarum]|uniref:WG repeat-containing protein n=1 Tax=Cohnella herbarum TaxID=2728023 RepID=A0A7Z2VJQ4_9BACL|nr:WG repeat-containing protein [Cohnella herbarum]QJD84256.1 WG repeat-containing protein [Cohnella herbarum]
MRTITVLLLGFSLFVGSSNTPVTASSTHPMTIEAIFDAARPFHEGLAAVQSGEQWGVIDKSGSFVMQPRYNLIEDFKNGYALVGQLDSKGYNQIGLIDKTGKETIEPIYYPLDLLEGGIVRLSRNGKYGLREASGKQIIPLKYDLIGDFREGLALVANRVNNKPKYGYIDRSGKLVIPIQYEDVREFKFGYAAVCKNGKWGIINKRGKVIIPLKYNNIGSYDESLFTFAQTSSKVSSRVINDPFKTQVVDANGKYHNVEWGAADIRTGKVKIAAQYDYFWEFTNGYAWVVKNNRKGIIDRSGRISVPIQYHGIEDLSRPNNGDPVFVLYDAGGKLGLFNTENPKAKIIMHNYSNLASSRDYPGGEGAVRVVDKNKKIGVIGLTGREVAPPKYDELRDFRDGFAVMKRDKKYGMIDLTGKEVIAPQYSSLGYFNEGLASFTKNGKSGYVDIKGNEVIPAQFENTITSNFSNGMAAVRIGNRWGYISNPL